MSITKHGFKPALLSGVALLASLAGCGGGGDVASTPPPTSSPSPTPAAPPVLTELDRDITFTGTASSAAMSQLFSDASITDVSASEAPFSISYDAASGDYTISVDGKSGRFVATDRIEDRFEGEALYDQDRDALYLSRAGYSNEAIYDSVAKAIWVDTGTRNSQYYTDISMMVYGYQTPANAIPLSGLGHYDLDIVASVAPLGSQVFWLQGEGDFYLDLNTQDFILTSEFLYENDLYTDAGQRTDHGTLHAAGSIVDGAFEGTVGYVAEGGHFSGNLSGNFYGENASEIGGIFTASNDAGGVLSGAFTGAAGDEQGVNIGLYGTGSVLTVDSTVAVARYQTNNVDPIGWVRDRSYETTVEYGPDGFISSDGLSVDGSDTVAVEDARANFDSYETVVDGQTIPFSVYKIGPANTEIELSYVSFYNFVKTDQFETIDGTEYRHALFGMRAPGAIVGTRTGTASYDGVLYGSAVSKKDEQYALTGSSSFLMDFSTDVMSGELNVFGNAGSADERDFGTWTFQGEMGWDYTVDAWLQSDYDEFDASIDVAFFGPQASEIGATFAGTIGALHADDRLSFAGVAMATED